MPIDAEYLRRHYESLSDEALLEIDRADLTGVAQPIFDQEIARRQLHQHPEWTEAQENTPAVFEPGAIDNEGPPPEWLEEAACPWSAYEDPSADYAGQGAEVQTALQDAGIPSRIVVRPPDEEPASTPRNLYCVMVPGDFALRANIVVGKVFNRWAIAEWRSQLQSFTDEELLAINPADYWGALLEKAEAMKRAYQAELAERRLSARRATEVPGVS
jgi:hypothetical protein